MIKILEARPGDAEALTRISFAAKRHWGYPESWIERWQQTLTVTPEFVRLNEVNAAMLD